MNIFDGSSTGSTRLAHLSGALTDLAHADYSSSGRAMVVQFTSDGSVSGTGFDASYSCAASGSSGSSTACTTIRCEITAIAWNRMLLACVFLTITALAIETDRAPLWQATSRAGPRKTTSA